MWILKFFKKVIPSIFQDLEKFSQTFTISACRWESDFVNH